MVHARRMLFVLGAALLLFPPIAASAADGYAWLSQPPTRSIEGAISPPPGFERVAVPDGSFADWLRHLPLTPTGTTVSLYDGRPLLDQSIIAAVVDIDTGTSDLQQCADAVMRLRAEFLYGRGLFGAIGFALFDGQPYSFSQYSRGVTPQQHGEEVLWQREKPRGAGHADLRRYLDLLFGFASTRSLANELLSVASLRAAQVGDVFIRPGQPGHAAIIADMAEDPSTGRRVVLLVQGSMPARGIYVLNNTHHPEFGAWFDFTDGKSLITPSYEFHPHELRRF